MFGNLICGLTSCRYDQWYYRKAGLCWTKTMFRRSVNLEQL